MSFSALTIPNQYMHGYSYIPFQGKDNQSFNIDEFKYIIDVAYNKIQIASAQGTSINGELVTKLTFNQDHNYKRGEVLRLYDSTGVYSGYITVLSVPSNLSIIANFILETAITGSTFTSNSVSYEMLPSPEGDFKIDISETTRNFLTQNTEFNMNDCFAGPDTRFQFDLHVGHKGKAIYEFYDNAFVGGNAGFISSGYTSVADVPFQIGDAIIIQQELYSWNFFGNFFNPDPSFTNGLLGLTGLTNHIFTTGDTLTVTGQITHPEYNGYATVVQVRTGVTGMGLVISKPYSLSSPSPDEAGGAFGVVTPQYNTTAVITDITYTPGVGVIIITNLNYAEATPPIGGTIMHIDGRLISEFDEYVSTGFTSYNSAIDNEEYTMTGMSKYVIKASASTENYISTLLSENIKQHYRIEPDSKSWLLFHNYADDYANGVKYTWVAKNGSTLATSFLPNISSNKRDFYAPVGIDQLLASTNRVDTGASLASIKDSIFRYRVEGSSSSTTRTNVIRFELNDDCSMYDKYHMMWKDKHGSWLSFPFNYIANITEESDKSSYYKTSGEFNNGTFGYNTWDRGTTEFYSKNRTKIRVNTGIVEQFENEIIKDLFHSAHRYIQFPDGNIYGCTITNSNLPLGDDFVEVVYNYTFDVQLTNNKIRL